MTSQADALAMLDSMPPETLEAFSLFLLREALGAEAVSRLLDSNGPDTFLREAGGAVGEKLREALQALGPLEAKEWTQAEFRARREEFERDMVLHVEVRLLQKEAEKMADPKDHRELVGLVACFKEIRDRATDLLRPRIVGGAA